MKIEFSEHGGNAHAAMDLQPWRVTGETRRLTEVMLSRPDYLAPIPCCSVTRESIRHGFRTDRASARAQHAALQDVLDQCGVACHFVPAVEGAPDLCFTRDVAVTTPWGVVALNPARSHRRCEVDWLVGALGAMGTRPLARIDAGTIEGGDICIVRPGLVIIGRSGERTDEAGADALASIFRRFDWEVLFYDFDPHFLHLDTIFCMLDSKTALACTDVLDDGFLDELTRRGIALVSVSYKEARALGANILSIDGNTIVVASGQGRIARAIMHAGFAPVAVDLSEFTACGGGVHCLTMPLARE
jgi:N-dimethylarginine dimethylaminohydrolase